MATASDTKRERQRTWFDGSLEFQSSLPLNHWLRPTVSLAVGLGKMWDVTREEDPDRDDVDSLMVNMDMALGLDFLLDEHWVLGARLGMYLNMYPSVHDEAGTRLDSRVLALGLSAFMCAGYEF